MSQDEFARALGDFLGRPVSQSQISDWERGRFEPGASILLAVAELADLPIDELRGSGPASIVKRLERLEDDIERLSRLPEQGEQPESEAPGELAGRMERLERELGRTGAVLAQVIQALDWAGLWHDGTASEELPARPPAGPSPQAREQG